MFSPKDDENDTKNGSQDSPHFPYVLPHNVDVIGRRIDEPPDKVGTPFYGEKGSNQLYLVDQNPTQDVGHTLSY
jgi:hypothetical protein